VAASSTSNIRPFCGVTGLPSWAFSIPWEERIIDYKGYKTWIRAVGKQPDKSGGFLSLFGKGKGIADNARY
jgi:hypothetical protein